RREIAWNPPRRAHCNAVLGFWGRLARAAARRVVQSGVRFSGEGGVWRVRSANERHGWRVLGIRNGFDGLIWPEQCVELTRESIRGILPRGGTIIGTTNRGNPFRYEIEEDGATLQRDFSMECMENWKSLGLDAMVVIGGDGTLSIANEFSKRGLAVVGVPKTIDNDLLSTDVTFGFDTALHVATDAIDRLHTT